MKLHAQFLQLHSHTADLKDENHTVETTLDELAAILDCTHRNALMIVQKMEQHDWIEWTPRRGRGRRSSLRFLIQPEGIAVQSMMQAIDRHDIKRALDEIRAHSRSSTMQEHLQGWLLNYFGHHAEVRSDQHQIDTLRLPIRQQLYTLDPLYLNWLAESFVSSHVFDGLARRANESGEILPGLAHAWEVDATRTKWTFFLRKEVLFHNGKILTAEDVVYTFERLRRAPGRRLYHFIVRQIRHVQALSPTMVSFELKEPNELFLSFLCTSRAAIVPRELNQAGEAAFGIRPVGTGAFKVTEMNESLCILEAFAPYFQGRAHLDRVEIVQLPWATKLESSDTEDTASSFHIIHNPISEGGTDAAWSQIHSAASVCKFITCNTHKDGPLRNPDVRARIAACLEQRSLPPEEVEVPDDSIEHLTALQIATIPEYRADAERVAAQLESWGYPCNIVAAAMNEFKSSSIRMESDLIIFSLFRDRDEQLRLYDLYLNVSGHVEPHSRVDIERLLREIAREADHTVRARLFEHIEAQLIQEHQLHILYEKPVQTAYLPSVRGVSFNSQGWVDLRHVWFPPALSSSPNLS
ncbi:ABC transporter substrate-binding protein [Paenibacillus farraposensis]|uniref:ABC transporter substrate-binding protein n=1 Tax=Paenibacillus farraposensis TaxID=2807095 RepID=A0ABW4DHY6_9BACL|nr:ABC transporter substrate-binding protein [Paenibacillus farraposensis]MCC3379607.1 SgrR family transcriptional regulator [Paenibacillus farraposensis]